MDLSITAVAALGFGFIVNLGLTPATLKLAHKHGWYDRKDHRKIHTNDMPRLGGVGIVAAVLVTSIVLLLVSPAVGSSFRLWNVLPVLAGLIVIHLIGLVDDFINLKARLKFVLQLLAAALVTLGPFRIEVIPLDVFGIASAPLELGVLSYPVTILWIVSVTNAVNLLDGMDGLAGGVSAIAALFAGLLAVMAGQTVTAVFAFTTLGALIGFLTFNFPPARIFMGDSGSLSLGFFLAVIPLTRSDGGGSLWSVVPMISLLMVPILDTVMAILRRIKNRQPISSPDKKHIHHKLLAVGLANNTILVVVYSACVVFGLSTIVWQALDRPLDVAVTLIVWILAVAGFFILDRAAKHRARPEEPV